MKILVPSASYILSDYLLSSEGTHCYQLFKRLASYDYEFEVLSPFIRLREPLGNVIHHQVGSFKISPTSSVFHKYAMHSEFLFRSLILSWKLLSKKRFDIIHHMLPAVFNYTFSPLSLSKKGLKQPFIFGPISAHYHQRPLDERVLVPMTSRLHRKTIQKCDAVITISQQVKNLYANLVDQQKLFAIPFGIDTEKFKPAEQLTRSEQHEILYAGSLYALKGVGYLVQAFAQARKKGLNARLTIIGEGQQKQQLSVLTQKLNVAKYVRFEGLVPYNEMPKYYQRCSLFCFPTLGEPFGKSMVEAMACGKPVIATNTGGSPEIIKNEENGILVQPANPVAMAEKIAELIGDEEKMCRIGARARETTLRDFSWRSVAERYHQLYSRLL